MRNRSKLWGTIASVGGAAFVIEALVHAPGVAYAVTAVALGLAYTTAARLTHSDDEPRT